MININQCIVVPTFPTVRNQPIPIIPIHIHHLPQSVSSLGRVAQAPLPKHQRSAQPVGGPPTGYILTLAASPRLDRDHAAFGRLCKGSRVGFGGFGMAWTAWMALGCLSFWMLLGGCLMVVSSIKKCCDVNSGPVSRDWEPRSEAMQKGSTMQQIAIEKPWKSPGCEGEGGT